MRTLVFVLALTTSLVAFFVVLNKNRQSRDASVNALWEVKTLTNSNGTEENYSAMFDGGVIFSVEKVNLNTSGNKTFYDHSNTAYSFDDQNPKHVVKDGGFVRLEKQEEGQPQDAIIVSLGQYVMDANNKVQTATETVSAETGYNAGITALTISKAKRDNEDLDIPVREIYPQNAGALVYFDFMYVIEEKAGNEGYYEFEFSYLLNGVEYGKTSPISFSFYLLFQTQYTTQTDFDDATDFNYTANPVIYVGGATYSSTNVGENSYKVGIDGVENGVTYYPTLVYDYTLYTLQYTYTGYKKSTTCRYEYEKVGNQMTLKYYENDNLVKSQNLASYTANNHLVSIMFTASGTYKFDFEYVYTDYLGIKHILEDMKVQEASMPSELQIAGAEMMYSKLGYNSAELKHFVVRDGNKGVTGYADVPVDLFVPNGEKYNSQDSYNSKDISFTYSYAKMSNDTHAMRVGGITPINNSNDSGKDGEESKNALVNSRLTGVNKEIVGKNKILNLEADELSQLNNIINSIKNDIKYVKTNQATIRLKNTDTILTSGDYSSYYFYKESGAIETTDITASNRQDFTNTTRFNAEGYYLVFIGIRPEGLNNDINSFYQIFAFQYRNTTIDIKAETIETNGETASVIGNFGYTNKDIKISWIKPGLFEKKRTARIYCSIDNVLTENELKNHATNEGTTITNGTSIGSQVSIGSFGQFYIELRATDGSGTDKIVTIDRENIKGIKTYEVDKTTINGTSTYTYYKNNTINTAIADGYSTINWLDKPSRAKISVSYTYTPFAKDIAIEPTRTTINGLDCITTKYKLDATVGPFDFVKPVDLDSSSVFVPTVLNLQGIYVFTLVDDAGNQCVYMTIVDKTETYVEIVANGETGYYSSGDLLFATKDVSYRVANYKTFELNLDENIDPLVKSLIENYDNLSEFKGYNKQVGSETKFVDAPYFIETGTNYREFRYLMSRTSGNTASYYLRVQTSLKEENPYEGMNMTSEHRRLTAWGINNLSQNNYTTGYINPAVTVINIEMNEDKSLGSAYYSDTALNKNNIPTNGTSSSIATKLPTGKDISGALGTSANYLAFALNQGVGKYEIVQVEYTFYPMRITPNKTAVNESYYYFDTDPTIAKTKTAYQKGGTKVENVYSDSDNIFIMFGATSVSGLYKVSRIYYYANEEEKASRTQDYYFIVDKNQIISSEVGLDISFKMLEDETTFKTFGQTGVEQGKFSISQVTSTAGVEYKVDLTTNKVPVTLNIPYGKYYYLDRLNGNKVYSSDSYYSGRLTYSMYFVDDYAQISEEKLPYYLYSSSALVNSQGILSLKFNFQNFQPQNDNLIRLVNLNNNEWLNLPGIYVVVIRDNIINDLGTYHERVIAFKVQKGNDLESNAPTVSLVSGAKEDNLNPMRITQEGKTTDYNDKITYYYSAITSNEFVAVEIPDYNETSTKAGLDVDYLMVSRVKAQKVEQYISYKNGVNEGSRIVNFGDVSFTLNNKTYVLLDTGITRDGEGNITDYEKNMKYYITVRYKLENEKYLSCYHYYDSQGEKVYYYEMTYCVIIDREAPSNNVETLTKTSYDKLLPYYLEELYGNSSAKLFKDEAFEFSDNLVFAKVYDKYYQANPKTSDCIYSLRATADTAFSTEDIAEVWINEYNDVENLSINSVKSNYKWTANLQNCNYTTYGQLFADEDLSEANQNGLYEVIELDKAGNKTQYILYYTAGSDGEIENLEVSLKMQQIMGTYTNVKLNNLTNGQKNFTIRGDYENNSYGLESVSGVIKNNNEYFYHIEVSKVGSEDEKLKINTKLSTDFSGNFLSDEIVRQINTERFGVYHISLISRTSSSTYTINYYPNKTIEGLSASRLVDSSKTFLNFDNAMIVYENIPYYATEIQVSYKQGNINKVDTYIVSDNDYTTYIMVGGGLVVNNRVNLNANTTYRIVMTTSDGAVDPYMFNTSGEQFYSVDFDGGDKNYYADASGKFFYGFTTARIAHDSMFETSIKVNGKPYDKNVHTNITQDNGRVVISPNVVGGKTKEELLKVEVTFLIDGTEANAYTIYIDTRTGTFDIREYTTGSSKLSSAFSGMNIDKANFANIIEGSVSILTGTMNLEWSKNDEASDYFKYQFVLYKDYEELEVFADNISSYAITLGGTYVFEVRVLTLDNKYIGNKIYAFKTLNKGGDIYSVVVERGNEVVTLNKKEFPVITLAELKNGGPYSEFKSTSNKGLGEIYSSEIENMSIPLFIYNQSALKSIDILDGVDKEIYSYNNTTENYLVQIYVLTNRSYKVYFATMTLLVDSQPIKKDDTIEVQKTSKGAVTRKTIKDIANLQVIGSADDKVEIVISVRTNDYFLQKNNEVLNIDYNGEFVKSVESELNGNRKTLTMEVFGNGAYTLVLKDKAGNTQLFAGEKEFDLTLYREVSVSISSGKIVDQTPVENAYYNDEVKIVVFNYSYYIGNSVYATVYFKGNVREIREGIYTFKEYGTYKVVISGDIKDPQNPSSAPITITKTLNFDILNDEEAKSAVNLSNMKAYDLISVVNERDEDVTRAFKLYLADTPDMTVTLDRLIEAQERDENPIDLKLTRGKQKFTLTYNVKDGVYPDRICTFSFTVNNETPKIECSLKSGETTNKEFIITFNPGIIYEQVGEAHIYINDIDVETIDIDSEYKLTNYLVSYKENGANDYYIKLVSESGEVLLSYKVTIKEPLNIFAIIVIIVVVAVVSTVVITIIVLRRKMRIR